MIAQSLEMPTRRKSSGVVYNLAGSERHLGHLCEIIWSLLSVVFTSLSHSGVLSRLQTTRSTRCLGPYLGASHSHILFAVRLHIKAHPCIYHWPPVVALKRARSASLPNGPFPSNSPNRQLRRLVSVSSGPHLRQVPTQRAIGRSILSIL